MSLIEFTFDLLWGDACLILNSVSAVGPFDYWIIFALLIKVKVPTHATDWDDKRSEQEYKRGYFEVLVLRVAVDNADWDDRVAERDETD